MTTRPFHHGNLRAVLLEQAEAMLRTDGTDGLSLRELARQAGVSHGAPRSHFIDRQALLDALAERGFTRLTEDVRSALATRGSLHARFVRVARAYVDFAVEDAALMELMFQAKTGAAAGPVRDASLRLFQVLDEAMGDPDGDDADPDGDARERFKLLFAATMQGIAALVAARRISREQGDVLVREAMDAMLESRLGARAITRR
ncbi:TetR/AcrR family transcriptional regulator [Clavibacter phaseoli]|jgi:AcrR family transcriptional regulator|uniref:TetR/AcrR family transcriptional regulator n=1 Tax=Clavibacter phaseoli TaxID=1734031 RepID=UPI000E66BAD3|nr:TetR/AcrR family transcriptional regulator [Clavibacter phaseoli]RIJ57215.1 TetR/AcrR family transcriptional regulator [Clavibacter phaseoli]UKF31786.1 TetR/AcrR family transcriptional regulator [Clavibacter phaseoli]UKF37706.1 TetR/AcrR family transcriptional regulator [Clavibacter phaseoli]